MISRPLFCGSIQFYVSRMRDSRLDVRYYLFLVAPALLRLHFSRNKIEISAPKGKKQKQKQPKQMDFC